ncbi:MAG: hypothetical protein Q7T83_10570 [Thermodesulfovibrionales bacterium]|nr:hypothetical protein [Thermodesulfovibrionales bacterium]MDP3111050.1 hypothetical protein [Thermodesulfovibrionales bacterium]
MDQLSPSEDLAKFIFNRSQFSALNERVKYSVYIPPPNKRLSVFRIAGVPETEVWQIGKDVGNERSLPLLARADIKVSVVTETGLRIELDDIPPRHANIIGWPEDASKVKLKAMMLADKAQLHLK